MITQLGLDEVVLVAHDASGPPAIDWALAHPARVAALVLLNTYYGWMPSLRAPEAITLYSTPILRNLARPVMPPLRRAGPAAVLLAGRPVHPGRRHAPRPAPAVLRAVRRRTSGVLAAERRPAADADLPRPAHVAATAFDRPVRIVFGADDPYLNARVARRFARLFPRAELELIAGARHYVQVDEPERVAEAIASAHQPRNG